MPRFLVAVFSGVSPGMQVNETLPITQKQKTSTRSVRDHCLIAILGVTGFGDFPAAFIHGSVGCAMRTDLGTIGPDQ